MIKADEFELNIIDKELKDFRSLNALLKKIYEKFTRFIER